MSKVIPTVTRNAASKWRGRSGWCGLRMKAAEGCDAVCRSARLRPSTPTILFSLSVPPNSSLIDTHFWRGFFFFSQAVGAAPGLSVKPAQPIRSEEIGRDEAPRPIEAEESARPVGGTVIRTSAQRGPTPECCLWKINNFII